MKIFLSYAAASFSTVCHHHVVTKGVTKMWLQHGMVDGAGALLRVERMLMISNFSTDIPYCMRDFSTKVICSLI